MSFRTLSIGNAVFVYSGKKDLLEDLRVAYPETKSVTFGHPDKLVDIDDIVDGIKSAYKVDQINLYDDDSVGTVLPTLDDDTPKAKMIGVWRKSDLEKLSFKCPYFYFDLESMTTVYTGTDEVDAARVIQVPDDLKIEVRNPISPGNVNIPTFTKGAALTNFQSTVQYTSVNRQLYIVSPVKERFPAQTGMYDNIVMHEKKTVQDKDGKDLEVLTVYSVYEDCLWMIVQGNVVAAAKLETFSSHFQKDDAIWIDPQRNLRFGKDLRLPNTGSECFADPEKFPIVGLEEADGVLYVTRKNEAGEGGRLLALEGRYV